MRTTDERRLKQVLHDLIETYRLRGRLNQTKIQLTWNKLMGPTIARYTTDIKVRNNKLYLSIASAALRQELSFGREKIRGLLNEELGGEYIKEVVVR